MSEPWRVAEGDAPLHADFVRGLAHVASGDWPAAQAAFAAAERLADPEDVYRNRYTAHHGLTLLQLGDISGINLCRRAAAEELHDPEVFACLARAELRLGHRRRGLEALRRGLGIDPGHGELRRLRLGLGTRRAPVVRFLSRDHVINRLLGRMTYRRAPHRPAPVPRRMV